MNFTYHLKKNIKISLPVIVTQIGHISVSMIDNIMVGGLGGKYDNIIDKSLGKFSLASASLGNSLFFSIMVFALGFSYALSPLVAAEDSKGNYKMANHYFSHSFILNLIISIILILLVLIFYPLLYNIGQPVDVIDNMIPYLFIVTYSIIPMMIFQTFRQLLEGLSLTIPVTIATIVSNLVNVILNYAWIYGNWGFKRLEVTGAAWATFVSRIVMVILIIIVMFYYKKTKYYMYNFKIKIIDKNIIKKILNIGVPTAFTSFFEMTAFSLAAFICGYTFNNSFIDQELAKLNISAHQIAINLASTSFMMCSGIAVAATVRVGNYLGISDFKALREAGWSCIIMVTFFMIFFGILFILFRFELPSIYLNNNEVITLTAKLLIIASLFQLFDGIQVVILGALRGIMDVRIPSILNFIAYWIISIPLGTLLAIHYKMRSIGIWIGLGVGLAISAFLLLWRYNYMTKKLIRKNNKD